MTTYNVTIDENTMINLLMNRVEYWIDKFDPAFDLYEGLITELVESGYFDGAEFNPDLIVDEIYINDTSIYLTVEDAIKDGYTEDNIAYHSDEGVIVWA